MNALLEAVPNFSEGRDPEFVRAVVSAVTGAGAEVLDASSDPDHNRSVVTFIGSPERVEAGAIAAARVAVERIDLNVHEGVHPRVGALDVMPFVPLAAMSMDQAVESAHRVGHSLSDMGLPVYWYAAAATPPGRRLADLRRGGFELLRDQLPEDRRPDLDGGLAGVHPTAGISCVGARPLLLAWNVWVEGVSLQAVRAIAGQIREVGGGFPGLRALGIELPRQQGMQISMNLEDVESRSPQAVFEAIEGAVTAAGGRVERTEVIGMIPDPLVLAAATNRLRLSEVSPSRLLSRRMAHHLADSDRSDSDVLTDWIAGRGDVPEAIRKVAARVRNLNRPTPRAGDDA